MISPAEARAKRREGGWSPRRDSNAQPEASEASALVRLSYVDVIGQGGRIRTRDLRIPSAELFLAELHPVQESAIRYRGSATLLISDR